MVNRRAPVSARAGPVAATGTSVLWPAQGTGNARWGLVGLAHAVLVLAYRDDVIERWCLPVLQESAVGAAPDLWIAVGQMQAAIAGGTHDDGLRAAGIGGRVSRTKRGAARLAIERLAQALGRKRAVSIRKWLKSAAGLARTAVGSMAKERPGGEIVAEALDGVLSGLDTVEAVAAEEAGQDDNDGRR